MDKLDWGRIMPEGFDVQKKICLHIFNHDVSTPEKIDRTIRFAIGRLQHYDQHLPAGSKHIMTFDLRGQIVTEADRNKLVDEIRRQYARAEDLETRIVQ